MNYHNIGHCCGRGEVAPGISARRKECELLLPRPADTATSVLYTCNRSPADIQQRALNAFLDFEGLVSFRKMMESISYFGDELLALVSRRSIAD